ncbi:hypothetical protein R1sor_025564 [Riccia sorocarpa]|uniref:Uncharacterized protein n=1 Tax=Riccia sorocarpa TaxID=122646 RepID=A0ABD3GAI2_9MARC
MNKLGNGGDFGPRFELVGAPIEIPDEALQQHRPPSPIRRSGRTVGDGADKDDGEDFDLDKEIDTQLGILDAEELRNIAAQEADEDEDEDEETNFVKEIDKQLDILNVEVAEGRMTFEEAGAVAAEAREGEAAAEPDDLNRYGVAIDQDAANLLPEITDPGVRQEMRKKWMVGGGPYVSKRWRPSPEVENSPFDLMPRAKEQLKLNCLKTSEMTLDMMKAEINCLIGAHENFADGVRVHCKPNCNPAVDPYQCCFYERFGLIDQISGRQERIVASLPLFDAVGIQKPLLSCSRFVPQAVPVHV